MSNKWVFNGAIPSNQLQNEVHGFEEGMLMFPVLALIQIDSEFRLLCGILQVLPMPPHVGFLQVIQYSSNSLVSFQKTDR